MSQLAKIVLFSVVLNAGLAAAAPSVEGEWRVRSRVCGVGLNDRRPQPPTDRFDLERGDQIILILKGVKAEILTKIDGVTERRATTLNQLENFIGSVRTAVYRPEADGSLTVLTGDFGDGGSCPVGATLFSNFVRVR